MKNINKIKLTINATIKEVLQIIDTGAIKFAIVVDDDNKLLGTITDGDIRRAILNGKNLEDSIENIYFKKPRVVHVDTTTEEIINICTTHKIYQIPVVDSKNRVVGIKMLSEILKPKEYKNKVVLMVGGLGTRLRPLTDTTPKPMLRVGGKPILQTIVEKFVSYGFVNIIMCTGYKSNIIKKFFKDGSQFGAKIEYIVEDKRMGTAGALTLLQDEQKSKEPFFVMNGDLLTNVNFENMLDFHTAQKAKATMCVREYDVQIPYGVVDVKNSKITSIIEKPVHKFFVNAGIYMLDISCVELIPKNEFYDMPTLFEKLITINKKAISFPLREYWLDIGRMDEFKQANEEYHEVF